MKSRYIPVLEYDMLLKTTQSRIVPYALIRNAERKIATRLMSNSSDRVPADASMSNRSSTGELHINQLCMHGVNQ